MENEFVPGGVDGMVGRPDWTDGRTMHCSSQPHRMPLIQLLRRYPIAALFFSGVLKGRGPSGLQFLQ